MNPENKKRTSGRNAQKGFSLLESAVVLVVMAVVISGVLVGRHLIRQSEVQATVQEYNDIKKAVELFKDQYGALPGDYANAEATLGCTACSGNGDGLLNGTELNYFWQHLSNARLIKGVFDPLSATPRKGPTAKASDGAYYQVDVSPTGGRMLVVLMTENTAAGVFSPMEAMNFDAAVDDGQPLTGRITVSQVGATLCNAANAYNGSDDDVKSCNLQIVIDGEPFYNFRWRASDWGACSSAVAWPNPAWNDCSVVCGTGIQTRTVECPSGSVGTQTRTVECIDDAGVVSAAANCIALDEPSDIQSCQPQCTGPKPPEVQNCTGPQGATCSAAQNNWQTSAWSECYAPVTWVVGAWGACAGDGNQYRTVTCPPVTGTQTREVTCPTSPTVACSGTQPVASQSCTITVCPGTPPPTYQLCGASTWSVGAWSACSAVWNTGSWGMCSASAPSCTAGVQTRSTTCDKTPATQTRTVTCPSPPCAGAAPASSQPCDQNCVGTPAASQACNVPSDLSVLNSISVLQRHTVTGASYVACLTPMPTYGPSDVYLSCNHAKLMGNTATGAYNIDHDANTGTAAITVQCEMASATGAYLSCADARTKGMTTNDEYAIDPDGITATYGERVVQCDMTTNGGGWTLVMVGVGGQNATSLGTASAFNDVNVYSGTATAKLSDAYINAVLNPTTGAYMLRSSGIYSVTRYFMPNCPFVQTTHINRHASCNRSYSDMSWNGMYGANPSYYAGWYGIADAPADAAYFITNHTGSISWLTGNGLIGSANYCNGAVTNCNFRMWVR